MVFLPISKPKIVKVRRIAIKALEIFLNYAKKRQTYDLAASEFNNKINIVEKRAILVALCKLGIPIVKPVDDVFCIEHVRFEHEEIDRDTINLMIEQINKGNCDELFSQMLKPISLPILVCWQLGL